MKPNNQFKVRQIVGITMLKYVIGFMDSKVISNTFQIILIPRNTFYHRYEIFFTYHHLWLQFQHKTTKKENQKLLCLIAWKNKLDLLYMEMLVNSKIFLTDCCTL